ncbi:2-methylcitrate dehydratase PrpD [Paraburkholderia unamae]|uniref:MmgE/PrpD family protein n=1 Tax=Paraburkholderia unamae TaxID=219649 RepID=UPI000DC2ACD6|nr:MmgE/PrpD family protein [Paraburkholderia unamae]RAR54575.1 2-methylcitrate dehydratase PrpD [Paraburkholderia unamae]
MDQDESSGSVLPRGYTHALAQWISSVDESALGKRAFAWASHALLDWVAVTIAASKEPLVQILLSEYGLAHESPCALLVSPIRTSAAHAALINGAAGHALDFDDVNSQMHGHPTVPVAPAALAVAQAQGSSGKALLKALIVGHEVEGRVGEVVGDGQYRLGLHPTGTTGTLGAAAASALVMKLNAGQTAHALGLAATQAAGLKSMFGTMAKPLHAGKAAMNGVMAARLAEKGFTANPHSIECAQGFGPTQTGGKPTFPNAFEARTTTAIERTLFKYHAACYLTHSTIEAVNQACVKNGITLDLMESMTINVGGAQRGVCDIEEPNTGLEVKFAIQQLAAMALDGQPTASLQLYSDETARNPRYVKARRRVALNVSTEADRDAAVVEIRTLDGRMIREEANVAIPANDMARQWNRLVEKAQALIVPNIGVHKYARLMTVLAQLDQLPTIEPLFEAIR